MDKLPNEKHEKLANDILKLLDGLTAKEIQKIIYRAEDLVQEKSKLIITF